MSYSTEPGHIGWLDLTVADAEGVRDFYARVAGWQSASIEMPDRTDYSMSAADGEVIGGVCHALGENAGLPAAWLVYINVADLAEAQAQAQALGGTVIAGPLGEVGAMRYAVLRDPAGAAFALVEQGSA
jgi:hypothetical protein